MLLLLLAEVYAIQNTATDTNSNHQRGSIELLTPDTVVSIGGRIRLDVRYGWPDGIFSTANTPTGEEAEAQDAGHLEAFARGSRFWLKSRTGTDRGVVRTLIEVDFFGQAKGEERDNLNAHGIRLRHIYAEVDGWTFGQTNSTFNSFAPPDILALPVNDVLARQPLVRYSYETGDAGYDISLELPETTLVAQDGSRIVPKDDRLPDVVGRVRVYPEWGEAALAFMVRDIRYDGVDYNSTLYLSSHDSALGWSTNVSAKYRVGERDDLRVGLHYGDGLGRYIGYNAYPAGSISPDGTIELQESFGGHAAYRHWWNPAFRSTLTLAFAGTNNNPDVVDTVTKQVVATYVNLFWTPLPYALLGVEVAVGRHELENGTRGDKKTVRMRAQFDF